MKIVRFALAILIAGARFAPATAAHNSAEPWQVMAIGDSITGSCYPAQLWRLLSEDHIGAFEFIGSRKARACGVEGFDGHTEWHPGYDPTALLSPPGTGRTEPIKMAPTMTVATFIHGLMRSNRTSCSSISAAPARAQIQRSSLALSSPIRRS
jgi:hypothetical protein